MKYAFKLNEKQHKRLEVLYDFLYVLGVQTVRIARRTFRRVRRFFHPVYVWAEHIYQKTLGNYLRKMKRDFHAVRVSFLKEIALFRTEKGFFYGIKETAKALKQVFSYHKRFFKALCNYAAPIAGLIILFATVGYWTNLNFGLVLQYNGEEIATIQSEDVYEKASEMVNQRLVYDTATTTELNITPSFALTIVDSERYANPSAVCDKLIRQSNEIIEEASGLYIDGSFIGAVKSSADLSFILQNILNEAKDQAGVVRAEFLQEVETVAGLFPTASILSADQMKQKISGTSDAQAITYTVQAGDTLGSIADRFQVSALTLNGLNANRLSESLSVGDVITVQATDALLDVKVTKTETYQQAIDYKTVTEKDDSEYTDFKQTTVEGVEGEEERTDEVTYLNGTEIARTNISSKVIKEPVTEVITIGTKKRPTGSTPGESSGILQWPVPSIHNITSGFGSRWGTTHWGIDIAGSSSYGQTIVAADGGTVSYVQYSDYGYGYHLEIRHANGMSTLYAHTSKILVSPGEKVAKGQAIALIGSTGDSTGPHCHFEVLINGSKVDPLGYVSP